jgi:hypothetical protein
MVMQLRVRRPIDIESMRVELVAPTELRLAGTLVADSAQTEIGRHLGELHAHVVEKKLSSLTVDVRALAFVNSSALRIFVDLVSRAQSAGYTLIFDLDSSITWHRLSFSVLKSLAPDSVQIRNHAPAGGGRGS